MRRYPREIFSPQTSPHSRIGSAVRVTASFQKNPPPSGSVRGSTPPRGSVQEKGLPGLVPFLKFYVGVISGGGYMDSPLFLSQGVQLVVAYWNRWHYDWLIDWLIGWSVLDWVRTRTAYSWGDLYQHRRQAGRREPVSPTEASSDRAVWHGIVRTDLVLHHVVSRGTHPTASSR